MQSRTESHPECPGPGEHKSASQADCTSPDHRGSLSLAQREQLEQRLLLAAFHLSHAQDIVHGGTDCRITAKVIEARSLTVSAMRWLLRDSHDRRLLTPAMVQALTEEGAHG